MTLSFIYGPGADGTRGTLKECWEPEFGTHRQELPGRPHTGGRGFPTETIYRSHVLGDRNLRLPLNPPWYLTAAMQSHSGDKSAEVGRGTIASVERSPEPLLRYDFIRPGNEPVQHSGLFLAKLIQSQCCAGGNFLERADPISP